MIIYKTFLAVIAALALGCSSVAAQDRPRSLQVYIDAGPGGEIFNELYGPIAVDRLAAEVAQLALAEGDTIAVATFGAPDLMSHLSLPDHNRSLTLGSGADHAATLHEHIGELLVQLNKAERHAISNLHARMEMAPARCDTRDVTTIILSNGWEIFDFSNEPPTFPEPILTGCGELIFLGFGVREDQSVAGLRVSAEKLITQVMGDWGYDVRFVR